MTVCELIKKLQSLPQDLPVKLWKTEGDADDEYSYEVDVEDVEINNDDSYVEKHPFVELKCY